jgi:hypothetical protein
MAKTTVVNIHPKGQKVSMVRPFVFIGRPSKWGNPFKIGRDGTREEVIEKYRAYIQTRPDLIAALPKLKGKRLGCYCKPLACHGDVLVELIEGGNNG